MTSSFGKRKHVYCTSSRKIHLLCAQRCGARSNLGLCWLADPHGRAVWWAPGQQGSAQPFSPSLSPAPLCAQHRSQTEASELSIPGLCGL